MPNLPSTQSKDPPKGLTPKEEFALHAADLISAGRSPAEIARKAYPKDKKGRNRLRQRLYRLAAKDELFRQRIQDNVKGKLILALPSVADGLIAKGQTGRPDAIKLLFEASGFHNPKMQHEHTGDIEIKLSIPRPEQPAKQALPDSSGEDAIDVDVVEE